MRYTTVEEELNERTHSVADVAYGINRFIIGLSKKVLIANTLGELVKIFNNTGIRQFYFIGFQQLPLCCKFILISQPTVKWPSV